VGEKFHSTLEAFVDQEIFSRLSGSEKRLLGAIAVFREPIVLEAINSIESETDMLDELVEKGLARQSDAESYDVHDLVREFLVRSMEESLRHELHSNAVEWYRNKYESAADRIEYIHHLHFSENNDQLSKVLISEGQELVKAGHTELYSILKSLESEDFENDSWGLIRELRGNILSIQGHWNQAEIEYDAAMKSIGKNKMI
jgi:hypothetical protein